MSLRIMGTGSALPDNTVTNEALSRFVETSDDWIRERTGIEKRHIATGESVVSLGSAAAKKAIEDAGCGAENIDLIIVACCSGEKVIPCIACQVQNNVGAANAVCFDINAACSGFLYALSIADSFLSTGIYKRALVIGAEVLSNIVNWADRSTCILFGDGAGAAVIEKKENDSTPMKFLLKSDGSKGEVLTCTQRKPESAFFKQEDFCKDSFYIQMDGREVFKFAVRRVPEIIDELLKNAGLNVEDVDLFLLHQANERILESIAKRLGVDMSKIPSNVSRVGNTSSASIPILLDEVKKEGRLKEGTKVVMSGFGAGLTLGACLLEI